MLSVMVSPTRRRFVFFDSACVQASVEVQSKGRVGGGDCGLRILHTCCSEECEWWLRISSRRLQQPN